MSAIYLEDRSGLRRLAAGEFPLSIGGRGPDVPLPGVAPGRAALHVGLSDGELFVQPSGEEPVVLNGEPLTGSRWLHDGDVLRIGDLRLEFDVGANGKILRVETETSSAADRPAAAAAPGAILRPVPFEPRSISEPSVGARVRPLALVSLFSLALPALAGWFLVTARAVGIDIEPAPDRVRIEGSFFDIAIDGRFLLRPGAYTLVAEKDGYRRLVAPVKVTGARNESFRFRLEKLDGILALATTPREGARVWIDGEAVGVTPIEDVPLTAGEHEIRIELPRYRDFTTRIDVEGGGATTSLDVPLAPAWAPVSFQSEPAGARLRVGGEDLGKTPLTADLLEGKRSFELSLPGFKTHRAAIDVIAGEPRRLPPIRLVPADGTIAIETSPPAAHVNVDGVYRGRTPLSVDVAPHEAHEIGLSLPGYEAVSRRVELAPGRTETLRVDLTARRGEIAIASDPADAEVYVEGEPRGPAGQTLTLPAVPHRIEVRKKGYETFQSTVTPRPDFPQTIRVELRTVEAARPKAIRTAQGQELRLIGPARFRMGASRREPGRRANETEVEVAITRPYYLGAREVSNREYREFDPAHRSGAVRDVSLDPDDHPVVRVTWQDAARYCNWLSERESLPAAYVEKDGTMVAVVPPTNGYRLPTEAEWARAARYPEGGAVGLKYPWGPALPVPPGAGNFADASAQALVLIRVPDYDDSYPGTAPVDRFAPNPLGIFQLGGNAAEWVHDVYSIPPPGSGLLRDPLGPAEGKLHVIRGSSWMHGAAALLRLSYRDYGDAARPDVGFRIARYADER